MAEGRGFPWRGAFIALAAIATAASAAVVGAYASGVRLTRAPAEAVDGARAGPPRERILWLALSQEQRGRLRRALVQAWREAEGEREAARDARRQVVALASGETYDPEAMREALAAMRAADEAVATKIHDSLAAAMADLSPTERGALLAAAGRFRGGRGGGQGAQGARGAEPPPPPPGGPTP